MSRAERVRRNPQKNERKESKNSKNNKLMSSVVNKSGTRFVPKARRRNLNTGPPVSKPLSVTKLPETKVLTSDDNDLDNLENLDNLDNELEGSTQVETTDDKNVEYNDAQKKDHEPLSSLESTQVGNEANEIENTKKETNMLKTSIDSDENESSITDINNDIGLANNNQNNNLHHVNTSRLSSLSKISDKSNLMKRAKHFDQGKTDSANVENDKNINGKTLNTTTNSNATTSTRRRLSSISHNLPSKIKVGMNSNPTFENDNQKLNTLKKRRLSTKTPISKKTGSSHRISIVSKIKIPKAINIPDPVANNNNDDELFKRTDGLYKKYTVKSIKEIPKNLIDRDSNKYIIDDENFMIADLCRYDLPIGEISENFERAKLAKKVKLERRKEYRELRKKAREEFKSLESLTKEERERELEERKEIANKLLNADIPEEKMQAAAPQLKLNAEGAIMVDEESTVMDRHKNANLENAHKKKVDENPFNNMYNYGSYSKFTYTDPWTHDELIKFYKALSMWGTDFNIIAQMFPYRTRKQIKSKFTSEERRNPVIIELALRSKLPPNFDKYIEDTRREIGTIEEFNAKLEKLQEAHTINLAELEKAKANAKLEDLDSQKQGNKKSHAGNGIWNNDNSTSRSEVVLGTIDDIKRKREEEERKLEEEEYE